MQFENEEDAKEYLRGIATAYNDDYPCANDPNERIAEFMRTIDEVGTLTLDAVTARIVEFNPEEA
jgi:hypothetical protein